MTKSTEREQARQLRREQGMSVKKIAKTLGVSQSSVSNWVRDIPLTEEQRQQIEDNHYSYGAQHKGSVANREKHRKIRLAYQEAGRQKAREANPLHLTGCMLYWAEGSKERNLLRFVNSDQDMMLIFINFLRTALNVSDDQIRIRINCYVKDDEEFEDIQAHWLGLLNLGESNVRQSAVNKMPSSSLQKGRKLPKGVCTLEVYSTKLLHHIYGAIQEYIGIEKPEWLD